MFDWSNIQLDTECVSSACSFFSEVLDSNKKKQNPIKQNLGHLSLVNKKIKCPPSKFDNQGKKLKKSLNQTFETKNTCFEELRHQTVDLASFTPGCQISHQKPQNHLITQTFIAQPIKRMSIQAQHPIPIKICSPIQMKHKDVMMSRHSSSTQESPYTLSSKGSRRDSKLSNALSLSELQMQTVKSMVDTTVECVKLQQSQIMLNFFESRPASQAGSVRDEKILSFDDSFNLCKLSTRQRVSTK